MAPHRGTAADGGAVFHGQTSELRSEPMSDHAYAHDPRMDALPRTRTADPAPAAAAGPSAERRRAVQVLFEGRGWLRFRLLVDAVLLVLGAVSAIVGARAGDVDAASGLVWLLPPLTLVLMAVWGLYRDRTALRLVDGIGQVIAATALPTIAVIALAALLDPTLEPAPLLARAWLFGTVYLVAGRVLLTWAQRRARAGRLISKPTLIVGAGVIGSHVERRLDAQPQLGLEPVGYLDSDPPPADMVPDRQAPVLGSPADLGRVVTATGARHVVLGFSSAPDHELIPLVRECEARGLEVSLVPRLFESVNVRVALDHLGGLPLFGLHSIDPKGWQFTIKHVFDRAVAATMLILLSPLLLAIAAAVRLSSPGPILFRQLRIGRDGRRFEMLKFRSMELQPPKPEPTPNNVLTLPTDIGPGGIEGIDRRTRIGAFLRRTSLDELPQLLNVLRGDMSLVGPRPERPEFVDLFGDRIARYEDRHRVRSGVTGWAQVHGLRGQTSLRDRVEWDNFYIENWSLTLDIKILLMTLGAIFTGSRDA
jgi:exopolysaccharide biosynthesis polyprenyl glycosylphosphotransferase